jgi:phosphatidylglycerophosphatase A
LIILARPVNLSLLLAHPAHFFGLGFGAGLLPKAPGTLGTLVGLPMFLLIQPYSLSMQWLILSGLFLLGVYICDVTGKAIGVSDHGGIVWDEIVAMMLVLTIVPQTWFWVALAFVLFRLFDIWKPFPIRQCDAQVKGGLGVMLDDLLAAFYSMLCLKGCLWISLLI